MRGIAEVIRKRDRESRLKRLKYKYPGGFALAVVGNSDEGFFLIGRPILTDKWEVLEHKKRGPSYKPAAMMPFFDMMSQMNAIIEGLNPYVPCIQDTTVQLEDLDESERRSNDR